MPCLTSIPATSVPPVKSSAMQPSSAAIGLSAKTPQHERRGLQRDPSCKSADSWDGQYDRRGGALWIAPKTINIALPERSHVPVQDSRAIDPFNMTRRR